MLIVICIISFILSNILLILSDSFESFSTKKATETMGLMLAIIWGISIMVLIVMIVFYPYNVDKKIEMYESENQTIENKVKETVRAYMEYEEITYKALLENAELTTMILKYPELNSNELVKMKIEMYKENSKKIKELKEERIGRNRLAWWLYFGH